MYISEPCVFSLFHRYVFRCISQELKAVNQILVFYIVQLCYIQLLFKKYICSLWTTNETEAVSTVFVSCLDSTVFVSCLNTFAARSMLRSSVKHGTPPLCRPSYLLWNWEVRRSRLSLSNTEPEPAWQQKAMEGMMSTAYSSNNDQHSHCGIKNL